MLDLKIETKLNHFNLKAELAIAKEILVMVGPSGSGKTTVLKCIAGLMRPDRGTIVLGNETLFSSADNIDIRPRSRKIGFVFQDYALFPHMTVRQNVGYGISKKYEEKVYVDKVTEILKAMNIYHLKDSYPGHLSGGEKQRVALARSLVAEPELLLLDEPLSALDADMRQELQEELKIIQKVWDIPFVLVTHDHEEAKKLGDSFARLETTKHEHSFVYTRQDFRRESEATPERVSNYECRMTNERVLV